MAEGLIKFLHRESWPGLSIDRLAVNTDEGWLGAGSGGVQKEAGSLVHTAPAAGASIWRSGRLPNASSSPSLPLCPFSELRVRKKKVSLPTRATIISHCCSPYHCSPSALRCGPLDSADSCSLPVPMESGLSEDRDRGERTILSPCATSEPSHGPQPAT